MSDQTIPAVTPLEGKTTLDEKMSFAPLRLSYQSADDLAAKIAAEVQNDIQAKATVVIAGTPLLADFANLQAVYLELEGLEQDYKALRTRAAGATRPRVDLRLLGANVAAGVEEFLVPAAAAAAAAGVAAPLTGTVAAALGLMSLFREDVEYRGVAAPVDRLAFELALAARVRQLHGADLDVFVPDLMTTTLRTGDGEPLAQRLERVQASKAAAWLAVGPLVSQLVTLEAELEKEAKAKNQARVDELSQEITNLRRNMEPVATSLGRTDQQFAELQARWREIDQSSGLTQLARLLRAEALHAMDPVYLHAAIVSSGGHYRVSRSLLRTIFTGDGLSFAGGAIARWALLRKDGCVMKGGILTSELTS